MYLRLSESAHATLQQSLSEEEQKVFRLYGKLPTRKDLLANKLKERKYFDSGDYALSKAGRAPKQSVGTTIPNPETVPHATHPVQIPGSGSGSPGSHASALSISPSHAHRSSMSSGSFMEASGTRSSFPMAGGMASSPSGEPTSSLSREQVPDQSSSMMQD